LTAALLRWWTVPRFRSHSSPSSTSDSTTAKNETSSDYILSICFVLFRECRSYIGTMGTSDEYIDENCSCHRQDVS